MNPSKSKGTAAESAVVKYLRSCGIPADRHALKGTADDHIIRELRARRVSRYRHDQPLTIHNIWRHH